MESGPCVARHVGEELDKIYIALHLVLNCWLSPHALFPTHKTKVLECLRKSDSNSTICSNAKGENCLAGKCHRMGLPRGLDNRRLIALCMPCRNESTVNFTPRARPEASGKLSLRFPEEFGAEATVADTGGLGFEES